MGVGFWMLDIVCWIMDVTCITTSFNYSHPPDASISRLLVLVLVLPAEKASQLRLPILSLVCMNFSASHDACPYMYVVMLVALRLSGEINELYMSTLKEKQSLSFEVVDTISGVQ